MPEIKSYHKQSEESHAAWTAFQDYLLMSKRSIKHLHQAYKERQNAPTKSRHTLKNWQDRHRWISRCQDYDSDQGEKRIEAAASHQRQLEAAELDRYTKIHRDYGVAGMQTAMGLMRSINEYAMHGRVINGKVPIESLNDLTKVATALSKIQPGCSESWAKATGIDELLNLWAERQAEES